MFRSKGKVRGHFFSKGKLVSNKRSVLRKIPSPPAKETNISFLGNLGNFCGRWFFIKIRIIMDQLEDTEVQEIEFIRERSPIRNGRDLRWPRLPDLEDVTSVRFRMRANIVEEKGPSPDNFKDRDLEGKLEELSKESRTLLKLRTIASKISYKRPLTVDERGCWRRNRGYFQADMVEGAREMLQKFRYTVDGEVEEICRSPTALPQFPPHVYFEGPKIISDLRISGDWMNNIKMVLIGVSVLTFYPILAGMEQVLNLGLTGGVRTLQLTYPRFRAGEEVGSVPKRLDFFNMVWERLNLIGLDRKVPVVLEMFTPYLGSYSEGNLGYILGFMRQVVKLQQKFAGILIVAVPPFVPKSREMLKSTFWYYARKRDREHLARVCRWAGAILGVPVVHLDTQCQLYNGGPLVTMRKTYHQTYLFNQDGTPTVEFYRRTHELFMHYKFHIEKLLAYDNQE